MRDLLTQLESANANRLYAVALFMALTIPDICGALESEDGEATPDKYKAWLDQWLGPRHRPNLTGEVCYQYRCAALHQGRAHHPKMRYPRILSVEPGTDPAVYQQDYQDGALIIGVEMFWAGRVGACKRWLGVVEGTPFYESNRALSMQSYPAGSPGKAGGSGSSPGSLAGEWVGSSDGSQGS